MFSVTFGRSILEPFDAALTDLICGASVIAEPRSSRSSPASTPMLLDQVRRAIRARHYSHRTEEAYGAWIKRFILFHRKKHPRSMGVDEIREYFTFLAVNRQVSASTENQALCALLFLYREVLDKTHA